MISRRKTVVSDISLHPSENSFCDEWPLPFRR
jgi:hypothetical protein